MGKSRILRRPEDWRPIATVAAWFALVIAEWIWMPPQPFVLIPLVALTCMIAFLGAVATHNTMHVPIFRAKKLNRLIQVALTLVYGHPVSSFVPGHNLSHHDYIESPRDVMRTTKARFRWHLLNLLFFMQIVGRDVMRAELSYIRAAWRFDRPWVKQLLLETTVWLSSSAVLLLIDWRKFLLFIVLPNMYASWGILAMNMLQHDGCDIDSEYNHSRNFTGKLINWLTFNNGFHTVHHYDANIHWSDLPKLHAMFIAPHIHPELVQSSLVKYVFRTYVWPGKRVRLDGTELPPVDPGPDEDWIANAFETADYGPMSHRTGGQKSQRGGGPLSQRWS